jgi:hypothetical protein
VLALDVTLYPRRVCRNISDIPPSTFYQNKLAMGNTADMTGDIDYDQTAIGLPPVTTAVLLIAK